MGALLDNDELLFPVLLLCDEQGEYVDFSETDIVKSLEEAKDSDIHYFKPTDEELERFNKIYQRLIREVCEQHEQTIRPVLQYNGRKIRNWEKVQIEQLQVALETSKKEVEELILNEMMAIDFLQKQDIRKQIIEKKKKSDKLQGEFSKREKELHDEAEREITRFNDDQAINPVLQINIVLKF